MEHCVKVAWSLLQDGHGHASTRSFLSLPHPFLRVVSAGMPSCLVVLASKPSSLGGGKLGQCVLALRCRIWALLPAVLRRLGLFAEFQSSLSLDIVKAAVVSGFLVSVVHDRLSPTITSFLADCLGPSHHLSHHPPSLPLQTYSARPLQTHISVVLAGVLSHSISPPCLVHHNLASR